MVIKSHYMKQKRHVSRLASLKKNERRARKEAMPIFLFLLALFSGLVFSELYRIVHDFALSLGENAYKIYMLIILLFCIVIFWVIRRLTKNLL